MARLLLMVAILAALAGCSGASPAASPVVVSPASLTATSPDLRPIAAQQYLAAVTAYNKATSAAFKSKACGAATLKQQRACVTAFYTAAETFLAALRAIQYPPDTEGDLRALIRAETTVDTFYRDAAGEKTLTALSGWFTKISKAIDVAQTASNLVRGDLGLPPVPISK